MKQTARKHGCPGVGGNAAETPETPETPPGGAGAAGGAGSALLFERREGEEQLAVTLTLRLLLPKLKNFKNGTHEHVLLDDA